VVRLSVQRVGTHTSAGRARLSERAAPANRRVQGKPVRCPEIMPGPNREHLIPRSELSWPGGRFNQAGFLSAHGGRANDRSLRTAAKAVMFPACQFTSFIVRSAARIAKSWSARRNGPEPNVPTADPPSWRKSFPLLPRPARRSPRPDRVGAVGTAAAAAVAAATTDGVGWSQADWGAGSR